MNEVLEHAGYLSDTNRLQAYIRALDAVVVGGEVVLDLGAGTGILGILALRAGAEKVYAVDSGPILALTRETARLNGLTNISFVRGNSRRVTLPERADLAICDQMGPFGFEAGVLQSFADAAARHLRPGGVLIPRRLALGFAPAAAPLLREKLDVWRSKPAGVDFRAGHSWAVNQQYSWRIERSRIVGTPCVGDWLDLASAGGEPFVMSGISTITNAGRLDAIAGWFTAELSPGIEMSNSPFSANPIDRSIAALPLAESVEVQLGDSVEMRIRVNPDIAGISWHVAVRRGRDGDTYFDVRNSSLLGDLLEPEDLARRNPAATPSLDERGRAKLKVLEWADGTRALAEIEQECMKQFGTVLGTQRDVQRYVRDVLDDAGC